MPDFELLTSCLRHWRGDRFEFEHLQIIIFTLLKDETGNDFVVELTLPKDTCESCAEGSSTDSDATLLYDWKEARASVNPQVIFRVSLFWQSDLCSGIKFNVRVKTKSIF